MKIKIALSNENWRVFLVKEENGIIYTRRNKKLKDLILLWFEKTCFSSEVKISIISNSKSFDKGRTIPLLENRDLLADVICLNIMHMKRMQKASHLNNPSK